MTIGGRLPGNCTRTSRSASVPPVEAANTITRRGFSGGECSARSNLGEEVITGAGAAGATGTVGGGGAGGVRRTLAAAAARTLRTS